MASQTETEYGELSEVETEQLDFLITEYACCLSSQEQEEIRAKIARFASKVSSRSFLEGRFEGMREAAPVEQDNKLSRKEKNWLDSVLNKYAASLSEAERAALFGVLVRLIAHRGNEAFLDGQVHERGGSWIPTSERYPHDKDEVLIWVHKWDGRWGTETAIYAEDENSEVQVWILRSGGNARISEVSHWQPMPDAPHDTSGAFDSQPVTEETRTLS